MTRPDKHAARFGARYTFRGTPLAALPVGTNTGQVTVTLQALTGIARKLIEAARAGTLAETLGWRH